MYFLGSHIIFRVEKTASDYVVSDLERDGRYKVWINAVSEGGVSPNSDVVYGIVVDRSKFVVILEGLNPLYTSDSKMCTLINSEDPDEMSNIETFHQGLHCLLRQKPSSEK